MSAVRPEQQTQDTLMLAARAAAGVSPTAGTVVDVLEHHALGHYSEGLRQYLSIRLGSPEMALAVLQGVRDRVAAVGVDELLQAPGIKARVFRMARQLADQRVPASARAAPRKQTLLWYRPRGGSGAYLTGIQQIRAAPHEGDRELLELRYARELSLPELAYVIEAREEEVEARLAAAEVDARQVFDAAGGKNVDLPRALLEAFALDKLEKEIASAHAPGSDDDQLFVPIGTVLDDQYELEKYIGSGGFADVYRARDRHVPGHHVALKLLKRESRDPASRDAALRELRLIASVFHPSIVQFKDHGWYENRFWFAMPWYEGETLEMRMEKEPLSRHEAHRIFMPLARALSTMHAAGVRHQDVKPDNIFLARIEGFGEQQILPVLIDLGVAATDAELVIAGTPTYFAPEVAAQFSQQAGNDVTTYPIGPAADVFALALSLRNALEPATAPDVAAGAIDTFIAHRACEAPEPPDGEDLRYLRPHFARWMSVDPADRPPASELAEELSLLTRPEEVRDRRMRNLRIFGPLAVALLVIFGTVVFELWNQAAKQADKAALLEMERATALESLEDESARREALESEIADARQRIARSGLTRDELARDLAEAEGNLGVVRRSLTANRRRAAELGKQVQAAGVALTAEQAAVAAARSRMRTLEDSNSATQRDLGAARRDLAAAEARAANIQQELAQARAAQASASNQMRELQASVGQLQQAQQQTQAALTAAERRVATLEQQLDAAERRNAALQQQLNTRPAIPATPVLPRPIPGAGVEVPSTIPVAPTQPTTPTSRPGVRRR